MIADRVGIRQPSLFHHFSRKADILTALIETAGQPIIHYVRQIDFTADPRVQLYQLVWFDVHFLLTEPLRINRIMALPEVRNGPLGAAVEAGRDLIIDAYRRLLAAGAKQKLFIVSDLEVVTRTVFGMGESTWIWYSDKLERKPREVAGEIAGLALRSVGVESTLIESLQPPEFSSPAQA